MKKLASILRLEFVPSSTDLALLVLRVWLGLSLLLLHGWSKLASFQKMSGGFMDPLGIGHRNSLTLAIVGEVLCSALLVAGLFTRGAALGAAMNRAVAFFLVHKGALKGGNNGELAFLYLAGFLTSLIAGPGRFALDAKGGKGAAPKRPKPSKD